MPKVDEQPWCPHCGAAANFDCHRYLIRCTDPECGRYYYR